MDTIIEQLNGVSERWFATMQLITWQAIVVFIFARCASVLFRRYGPEIAFWIWTAAGAKIASLLVIPMAMAVPVWQLPAPARTTAFIDHSDVPIKVTVGEPIRNSVAESPSPTGRTALFVIWAAIVLAQLVLIMLRRRALSQLLRRILPASVADQSRLDALRDRLGIRFPVSLGRANIGSPFVTGVFRPRIVLPLNRTNSPKELDHVLLHELSHIKRRDLVWAWVPEITRVILFFHPVVYWISQEAKLHREAACDQTVVLSAGGASEYARTLLAFSKQTQDLTDNDQHKLDLANMGTD